MVNCNKCGKIIEYVYEETSRLEDRIHVECLLEALEMNKWQIKNEIRTEVIVKVNKKLDGAFVIDKQSLTTYARKIANSVFEKYIEEKIIKHIPKFNLLYTGSLILLDLTDEELENSFY